MKNAERTLGDGLASDTCKRVDLLRVKSLISILNPSHLTRTSAHIGSRL